MHPAIGMRETSRCVSCVSTRRCIFPCITRLPTTRRTSLCFSMVRTQFLSTIVRARLIILIEGDAAAIYVFFVIPQSPQFSPLELQFFLDGRLSSSLSDNPVPGILPNQIFDGWAFPNSSTLTAQNTLFNYTVFSNQTLAPVPAPNGSPGPLHNLTIVSSMTNVFFDYAMYTYVSKFILPICNPHR